MLFNSKTLLRVISSNIKQQRQARQWSQQKLAAQAEISRRHIQMIEGGEKNISLAMVCRIADAFDITFHDLITEPPLNEGFLADTRDHGIQLWHGTDPGTEANLLECFPSDPTVEVWEWAFAPGESYQPEPILEGTKEMIYVVDGELTLEHENHTRILKAWDSITFPSDREHTLRNSGTGPLRLIWLFTIKRARSSSSLPDIRTNGQSHS